MSSLVIGASGQLGSDLCRVLGNSGVVPLTHAEIEITDISSVREIFKRNKLETVINTAAYVRVDDCEDDPDTVFRVNAMGAQNVAVIAQEHGARLVHISTDYVFGGEKPLRNTPYTEFDNPAPLNVYGQSKAAGENMVRHFCLRHFIVRTSALFGLQGASGKGGNFVETMLNRAKEMEELRVVDDQIFSPTYTMDLARKITQIIKTDCYGIYHVTNKGSCSWYEFTKEILRQAGLKKPINPITSGQYPQKAVRPKYSVLDNYHLRLLGMDDMRPWQEALGDYLKRRQNG